MSLAWRPRTEDAFDRFLGQPHRPGPAGSVILAERGPGDERVLAFPAYGVLAVEGRLGAILSADAGNHDLVPAKALKVAERDAGRTVRDLVGWEADEHTICEVRRYDLARELRFDDGADGLAFLRTLGGMCPPRARTTIERSADGHNMTVYVRTPKRGVVLQRFYDKGIEAGTHAPGERIRLEAQLRPPKSKRMSPATLARLDLRSHFIGRMATYVNSKTDNVVAAGSAAAVEQLLGQVARGEVGMAKAERMLGSMVVLRQLGRAAYDDRQGRRRLADLRSVGVALEDELPADRLVPVGDLLRQAVEDFAA